MLRRRLDQRLLATAGVLLAVLAGAATLYAAGLVELGSARPGIQTFSSGAMSVSNSKDGAAIFDLSNIGPGISDEGEVTIGNSGAAPGTLALSSLGLSDAPGIYGGALSEMLELRIADVTGGADVEVYAGALASMPEMQLGTLVAGASRTYRFSVGMRDGGSPSSPYVDDNLYQRAAMSLGYQWTLTETEGGIEPPEPLPPDPAVPAGGSSPPVDARSAQRPLVGDAHPNSLVGTPRHDLIYGLGAADAIFGRGGDDYIFGGAGADRLHGGLGADRLRGGTGPDAIAGGEGPDVVFARDGEADFADCGAGADTVFVDAHDRTRNCESVYPRYGRLFEREPSPD